MRLLPLSVCAFFLLPLSSIPQTATRPIPPGVIKADKVSNRPLDPPLGVRSRHVNVEQMRQESEELRKLADGIPRQIQQATSAQLPENLPANLKRIEKLAKHLRSEILP